MQPITFTRHITCDDTGIEGICFAEFTYVDVVRHPLVQEVIRAYDRASP